LGLIPGSAKIRREGFTSTRNGEPATASLGVGLGGGRWTGDIEQGRYRWRSDAEDAFAALTTLREQQEPIGFRFGLNGALADVWPSGQ
jgi:hypothetical protein